MEIRKKTILIIALTLLGLIIVLLALSEYIVIGGFTTIEKNHADEIISHVVRGVSYDLVQMDTMGDEWREQETILDALQNPQNGSERLPFDDRDFERLQYNVIILFDKDGRFVAGKMYDLNAHHVIPLTESLSSQIVPVNRFYGPADAFGVRGVLSLPEGPMLVSLRWVNTSSPDKSAMGSLMFGRYLDQQVLLQISALTNSSLEMFNYYDAGLPPDVTAAKTGLGGEERKFLQQVTGSYYHQNASTFNHPVNESLLFTYAQINDIYGSPAVIMRIAIPREISNQGKATTTSFIILFFLACLSFGIVILLLLENTVLSRLMLLSGEVSCVGKTGDCSIRVSDKGTDEIGRLAGAINWMLREIEVVNAKLKTRLIQSEERYRIFFNSSNDIVFVYSLSESGSPESIIEVNDAGCQRLGYSRDQFLNLAPECIFGNDQGARISELTGECIKKGHISATTTFVTKENNIIPTEIYAHAFHQLGKPAILAVCHDITERIENERMRNEAFSQIEQNMEKFAILNDHIRNPLQVIMLCTEYMDEEKDKLVTGQIQIINRIITQLDQGYLESEKIRNFLKKHYSMGKK